jgi:hypothetical protein
MKSMKFFISEVRTHIVYLYFSISPVGVTLGVAELASRPWTRISHRAGLLFESFQLLKILFFQPMF